MPIHFFSEGIDFQLASSEQTSAWLQKVATKEGYAIDAINYIFCDDAYLHQINKTHLQHDALTDIITFDYRQDAGGDLLADIYISVPQVRKNALGLQVAFLEELSRVMVHGILHLLGYDDKTPALKANMRAVEDRHLAMMG